MNAVLTGSTLASTEILGVERGAFFMLAVSVLVLLLGVPVAARLGNSSTTVFRRTSLVYGGLMLVLLFGTFLVVKQAY